MYVAQNESQAQRGNHSKIGRHEQAENNGKVNRNILSKSPYQFSTFIFRISLEILWDDLMQGTRGVRTDIFSRESSTLATKTGRIEASITLLCLFIRALHQFK
jgi:hypothetical protein